MSLSISIGKETKPNSRNKSLLNFQEAKMCAVNIRFDIDINEVYHSTKALAPKMDIGWQSQLEISTSSKLAKHFFNQGLFYLYAFNHAEADRSFKEAIRQDSTCALCHWGVAIGLGPNINSPMNPDKNEEAYDYVQKAKRLSLKATAKEKALIHALCSRYTATAPEDRTALDSIYADEMRYLTQRYRTDLDIATLFVESLMNCMPWQYWKEDDQAKPRSREALSVLDYILEQDPKHPGANHYYIHLVEEVHPQLGLAAADALQNSDFPAGHLVHMPSHIYIRTGRYREASEVNERAIKIDEDYISACNIQGIYPAAYYPHNIHFLWYAASMEGNSALSMEAAKKLVDKSDRKMIIKIPSLERYLATPYFSMLRFGKWDDILKEKQPQKDLLFTNLIWHYARGMAYSNKGKLEKAKGEMTYLEQGLNDEEIIGRNSKFYPVLSIIEMSKLVLSSEINMLSNDHKSSIKALREAVKIQDALVYDEPPPFYFPIRQALGQALISSRNYREAEKVFREDLEMLPNNGWSLIGFYQSLKNQDRLPEAKKVKTMFDTAWQHADIEINTAML